MVTDEQGHDGWEPEDEVSWLDLYPVYEAPNEDSAIHVRAFLESAGIEARIRSAQVPGFDGAFAMAVGYCGQVLVPRREVVRARDLLEGFLDRIEGDDGADASSTDDPL